MLVGLETPFFHCKNILQDSTKRVQQDHLFPRICIFKPISPTIINDWIKGDSLVIIKWMIYFKFQNYLLFCNYSLSYNYFIIWTIFHSNNNLWFNGLTFVMSGWFMFMGIVFFIIWKVHILLLNYTNSFKFKSNYSQFNNCSSIISIDFEISLFWGCTTKVAHLRVVIIPFDGLIIK